MLRSYCFVLSCIVLLLSISITSNAQYWDAKGNSNLPFNSFLGTTDNNPLSLRTNKIERLRFDVSGKAISMATWGLGMQPVENYRLSVNGNLLANDLTATSVNSPTNENLTLLTGVVERLSMDPYGRIWSYNTFWGINSEPVQEYRLSVGGKIWSEGLTTQTIAGETNKMLVIKTNGQDRLTLGTSGQVYADDKTWWGIGTYPSQGIRLSVKGTFQTDSIASQAISTNNLQVKNIFISNILSPNGNTSIALSNGGSVMVKGNIGINIAPEEDYSLLTNGNVLTTGNTIINGNTTIEGNSSLKGHVKIGQVAENEGSNYSLAVGGNVICEEVKVEVKEMWPDYVFHKSYNLMPLQDIEKYIQQNNHLPGIPSAEEVKDNKGIEVGNMQKLLLQKIEELTLHMIELKKENDLLKEKIGLQ